MLVIIFYLGVPVILIAGWIRVARAPQKSSPCFISLSGFVLGSASAALAIGGMLWSAATGGFRYYAPELLRIFRIGILLSLAGLMVSLGGVWKRNSLRWHAPVLSLGMLLLWFFWTGGE